jgi:hypothetical protein
MNNNISGTEENAESKPIDNIIITNENEALNAMVSFLQMAQKRGAFNLQEAGKIWDCIQMFIKK